MELQRTQREERIRVDRKIVNLLSRATYESFPRVLRELVSNAYDADATKASIDIDIRAKKAIVTDNGNGMSPEQFHYFLTIAATMRTPRPSPRYQRERIGQFGVGFLAAFPFCEEMTVETTASDSPVVTTAIIPCAKYLKEREGGTEVSLEPVEEIPVPVSEISDPRERRNHYTKIILKGLTSLALQYFGEARTSAPKRSVKSLAPMERLEWDLQDTTVLDYPPGSIVATALGQKSVGMELFLGGKRLYRNEPPGEILENHGTAGHEEGLRIDGLQVRYVITSPWKPIHPVEMRGLRIRVNNVGVGPRETFGLAVQAGALPRLSWLSGDVYIDKGGREYLALDREGFTNAPSLDSLREYFRSALRRVETQISEADTKLKEVETQLGLRTSGGGPRPKLPVLSKREAVNSRIRELQRIGFKVEREPAPPRKQIRGPVEIDRQSRVIRIYEQHPDFKDVLVTSLGKFTLEFDSWDFRTAPFPACERRGDDVIRVNSNYPLFKSRSYGRLFLRVAVTLAVLSDGSKEAKRFARKLLLKWVKEFRDLAD